MKAEKRRVKTQYKMRIVCFFITIVFKNQEPRCQDAKEEPRTKMPKKNQEPRCQEAKEASMYKIQRKINI